MSSQRGPMDPELSRRLFGILGLGVAGSGALAACQAQPDGGDGSGGGEPDDGETAVNNPERVFHGAVPYQAPPTGHFNMAPGLTQRIDLSDGMYFHLLMAPGGLWDWAEEEWLYLLAESFEFTETEFVYTLKPDLAWSDGSPLTAEDLELTFWVRWLMNQQEWPMIAGLERTSDLQVTFSLDDPSTVFERRVMKAPILPAAVYGEFGERARDLFEAGEDTDGPDANELREELQAWRPEDNESEVLVSGPYMFDFGTVSEQSITLVRNEHGVLAEEMNFETLVIYNGETDDVTPLVLDGTIDYATQGFTVSTQQEWESAGIGTKSPAFYTGCAVIMSYGRNPEFADVRFRRALAHMVDREAATIISMDAAGGLPETMSGMPELQAELWLDEATAAELDPYEFDQDRAAELLEDAGWTRSNGIWITPEGNGAEYAFTFQSDFAGYSATARYYAEELTNFGIAVELNGIESPNMSERLHTGQFDFATVAWGGDEPHPHYAYTSLFINDNEPVSRNHGGRGMDYDLVREVEGLGEVDIQALVTGSGEGLDEERHRELINELALVFNAELPKVPVWERFGNNPVNEGPRVLEFPADDDSIWASATYSDNPVIQAMYRGMIHPS